MITTSKHGTALAAGFLIAAIASPGLDRAPAAHVDHPGDARARVIQECNGIANKSYPWFEDVNRMESYRACMSEHGKPES